MIHYYSRSKDDLGHLYKFDDETKAFYYMDHCWTGEGVWCGRSYPPAFGIVEISYEEALSRCKGNIKGEYE